LGTALLQELLAQQFHCLTLVRDYPPASDFFRERLWKRVRVVRGRIEDRGRFRQLLAIHDIQAVIHLAAPTRRAANDYSADWLYGIAEAVAEVAPRTPILTAMPRAAITLAEQLALSLPAPVQMELLPTLFGPNDRRTELYPRRASNQAIANQRIAPPSLLEAEESFASVVTAACHLVNTLQQLQSSPRTEAEVRDTFPGPVWSGLELWQTLSRPAARTREPMLTAALDELKAWCLRCDKQLSPTLAAA
jgi:hypothetical protein